LTERVLFCYKDGGFKGKLPDAPSNARIIVNSFWRILLFVFLSACASIRPETPPVLSPFGDGTQWIVLDDLRFVIRLNDNSTKTIIVPKGFVTDLASTPREIWSLYPPFGKYLTASILHDYLYWRRTCTQDQADKILFQTMQDAGVDPATQARFFLVLQKVGERAWKTNASEVAAGLIRVLPNEFLHVFPDMTWDAYRVALHAKKITEPKIASDKLLPGVCAALGNEIQVQNDWTTIVFGR
jgi:hypothetical protein